MSWRLRTPARAKRSATSGFIVPCAPTIFGRPPRGSAWIHEIKHDGYRLIARKDEDRVRLWTRLRAECSGRFEQIAEALRALPVGSCTIDGEAVVLRDDGRSDFRALRGKDGTSRAVLIAFDLLDLDGEDLRCLPLYERRALLASLLGSIDRWDDESALLFSEAFEQEGMLVYAQACALGLEGIVSKRRSSFYRSGPSADWIKTRNPKYQR